MIRMTVNGYSTPITFSTFPGGEEHVAISLCRGPIDPEHIRIAARLDSSSEVMRLLMLRDAISNKYKGVEVILDLGYLPYARQDRICAKGEALSIKVFCDLINVANFDEVYISDCHSDVGLALLDRCVHTSQLGGFVDNVKIHNLLAEADVIVIPDLGAVKKAEILAQAYNLEVLQCMKLRVDRDTIKIKPLDSKINYLGGKLIVADDICDGGGTFLALADALTPNYKSIDLVVTHGIFSKGTEILKTRYNNVEAVYDWTE